MPTLSWLIGRCNISARCDGARSFPHALLLLLMLFVVGCNRGVSRDPAHPRKHAPPISGYPSATEYFLPHPTMPDDVLHKLPPWMKSVATSDLPGVNAMLQQRFSEVQSPELKPLADQLRSYQPISIVVMEDQSWIRLDSTHNSEVVGGSAFLPVPPDALQIRQSLATTDFQSNRLYAEFMTHFAGLAEDFLCAGNFVRAGETWETLSSDWHKDVIDNYEEWRDSLLIYHARNGDHVLLRSDGRVGWWQFAEGHIEDDYASFADFLSAYVSHRQKTAWPLDSYGPPATDPTAR